MICLGILGYISWIIRVYLRNSINLGNLMKWNAIDRFVKCLWLENGEKYMGNTFENYL